MPLDVRSYDLPTNNFMEQMMLVFYQIFYLIKFCTTRNYAFSGGKKPSLKSSFSTLIPSEAKKSPPQYLICSRF